MRPPATRPVLLALLVALLVVGPALVAGDSPTPQSTRYYFLASDDAATYTLFARQQLDRPDNGTLRFALPLGAQPDGVSDQDGRALQWARAEDGWIVVAVQNDTRTFTVTARDLPGPGVGTQVRFPADLFPAYVVYLGLPDGHTAPDGEEVAAVEVRDVLAGLPVPDARTYHLVRPDTMGAALSVTAERGAGAAPFALLAALIVLLAATTVWLMVRVQRSTDDPTRPKQMPILDHLEELRRRLFWIVGIFLGAAVFFFSFGFRWMSLLGVRLPVPVPSIYGNAAAQVFSWLTRHVVPPEVTVVVISPWDAVVTQITVAFALGILVAFPVLFDHGYSFIAPALYPKERRAVFVTVPVVVALFALGAAFGVGLMLPFTVRVLYGFAGTLAATAFLNVPDLVSIGALMAVVFGLAFELPVVMALLSGIGVVPARTWRKNWRIAVILIAVAAALVTDPTVITQLIVASVLLVLYGIGVVLAVVFENRRAAGLETRAG